MVKDVMPTTHHDAHAGTISAGSPRSEGVDEQAIEQSREHCREIARTKAENFYYGMKLTPEPKRTALYVIYAFMRACDDLADQVAAHESAAAALKQIETFRQQMQSVIERGWDAPLPSGPIWPAFCDVMQTYPIDPAHLHAMLDGQCDDLRHTRYDTFEALYDYCYKVASTVGLVCISVWGHDGDASVHTLAEHRGIALQLTNILRDLVEDARRGRVYLPASDIAAAGIDPDDFAALLLKGQPDAAFDRLMADQIQRADDYYRKSASLEAHLDPTCRATSWGIMQVYRALFDRIARDPRQVLRGRVRLPKIKKISIAAGAWLRGRRQR